MTGQRVLFLFLSGLIWVLVTFAPNGGAAGDAWGSLLTAQALVEHGNFDLSSYEDRAVLNDSQFFRRGPHVYYWYPPGAALLEVPLVALTRLVGLDMADVAQESFVERQVNAICMIAVLGALYHGLSALLGARRGLIAAFVILLASTYSGSIASSMANSQMPEIVFLTWTQAWLLRFDYQGGRLRGWPLGLFLGLAYLCRPTALLWAPPLFLYLAVKNRAALAGAVLSWAVIFLGFKLALGPVWGGVHPYYGPRSFATDLPTFVLHWVGIFVSPGVGLFVYQPLLVPPFLLAPFLMRRRLLAWVFLLYAHGHALLVALQSTWMTAAFGPRLMAEASFPLWFLAVMVAPQLRSFRFLLWPALLWSLWLNTCVAFFRQTQHLHFTATRPEQDPAARGLWDWRLAPFLVTQEQMWQLIREGPAELFPALNRPNRFGFRPPEQAGDLFFVRPESGQARLSFQSGRPAGLASGLVNLRYNSPEPVGVRLNGRVLGDLPPGLATRRYTLEFAQLDWRAENELEFSGGPDFRLFDVMADTIAGDQTGIVGFFEGFSGDEGGTRWALGPCARALVIARQAGRVAFQCQALNPHLDLNVEVWCNGSHSADFRQLPEGEATLCVELDLKVGENDVELRFSRWGIPGARDQRPLALRLQKWLVSPVGQSPGR